MITGNEVEEGTFPCSIGSDYCGNLTPLQLVVNISQHLVLKKRLAQMICF